MVVAFRFCDAMIEIRKEAQEIVDGNQPKDNNLLKNAPHPLQVIVLPENEWNRWVFLKMKIDNLR